MLCPLNYCTTKKECDHCCGRIKKHLSFPIPEKIKKNRTRFFFFFFFFFTPPGSCHQGPFPPTFSGNVHGPTSGSDQNFNGA
ncbi:hypothetical protein LY78DRAFT_27454 [Colletotrichum sublineola]|nr:hypothetical protein LY78DRAFT_27454 [Colletotrichum sublineola]